MSRLALLATWMVLFQALPATARPEDYAVQLDRPAAVGQRYVVAGSRQEVTMTAITAGQEQKREQKAASVRFELGVKVLEVGLTRRSRRAVLTVHRLTREAKGATEELFAPGTTVEARLDGHKEVFEIGGKSVEGDAQPALSAAAGLHPDDSPTDDEVLGSQQRRSIGESWPINSNAAIRALGISVPADSKGVTGSATLVARRRVRDVPCLEYRFKLDAGAVMPAEEETPGFKSTLHSMTAVGSVVVPLNPLLPEMGEDLTVEVRGREEGIAQGAAVTFEIRVRSELHLERAPAPVTPDH